MAAVAVIWRIPHAETLCGTKRASKNAPGGDGRPANRPLDPFNRESQARGAATGGSVSETGSHREPKMAFPFLTAQSENKRRGEQSALSFGRSGRWARPRFATLRLFVAATEPRLNAPDRQSQQPSRQAAAAASHSAPSGSHSFRSRLLRSRFSIALALALLAVVEISELKNRRLAQRAVPLERPGLQAIRAGLARLPVERIRRPGRGERPIVARARLSRQAARLRR